MLHLFLCSPSQYNQICLFLRFLKKSGVTYELRTEKEKNVPETILKIAKNYDLFVIEDCAEAHGAEVRLSKIPIVRQKGSEYQKSKYIKMN